MKPSTRSEHDFLMDEEEAYRRFLDEKDCRDKPLRHPEIPRRCIPTLQEQAQREKRRQAIADKEDMFGPDGLTAEEKEILEGPTCGKCKYSNALYCFEMHQPRNVSPSDPACEWFKRRGEGGTTLRMS